MSVDESLLSYVIQNPKAFNEVLRTGITEDYFVDEYEKVWAWLARMKNKHGKIPSRTVVETRYPDLEFARVRQRDIPILVHDLRQRKKYMDFLTMLDEASRDAESPEDIDEALAALQGGLNSLSARNGMSSIVDLFGDETTKRMTKDLKRRKKQQIRGIPTGLKRFDGITGGLQKGRLVTIIGRPGLGKSWLDLLFVASAVQSGAKVILYPLEMSLEDTALRLYTIFSCKFFGQKKAIRNLDLANGRISMSKIVKLMGLLQDKYEGQLLVADIGSMSDPYTMDRVGAEGDLYKPDMQWIDYLTLMKAPGIGRDGGEDHTTVKALSNGAKQVAVRGKRVVGISAQVNRNSISGHALLPRLENIAYGDSIGQDADHVLSINRKKDSPDLYYGLIKNRHGPETGKIRVRFFVDRGLIEEHEKQEEDED